MGSGPRREDWETVSFAPETGLDTAGKEIPLFPDKVLLVGGSLLESRGLTEKLDSGFKPALIGRAPAATPMDGSVGEFGSIHHLTILGRFAALSFPLGGIDAQHPGPRECRLRAVEDPRSVCHRPPFGYHRIVTRSDLSEAS